MRHLYRKKHFYSINSSLNNSMRIHIAEIQKFLERYGCVTNTETVIAKNLAIKHRLRDK